MQTKGATAAVKKVAAPPNNTVISQAKTGRRLAPARGDVLQRTQRSGVSQAGQQGEEWSLVGATSPPKGGLQEPCA